MCILIIIPSLKGHSFLKYILKITASSKIVLNTVPQIKEFAA